MKQKINYVLSLPQAFALSIVFSTIVLCGFYDLSFAQSNSTKEKSHSTKPSTKINSGSATPPTLAKSAPPTNSSGPEVMFEGYYTIKSGETPVGYVIQQYSYDAAKKHFFSTYYIKTNRLGGDITESLKAESTNTFEPIKYQYTSRVGEKIKTIDAKFEKQTMTAVISDGKKANTVSKKLNEGVFLSTFLGYLMMSRGISKGKNFTYSAIAEEDGDISVGKANIEEKLVYANISSYRIANRFKNTNFISYMSEKGEVLATRSPLQNVSTTLESSSVEATKGFRLDTKVLKLLFGKVPSGRLNEVYKNKKVTLKPLPKKADPYSP